MTRITTRTGREAAARKTLKALRGAGAMAPAEAWRVLEAALRRGPVGNPAAYLTKIAAHQADPQPRVVKLPDGPVDRPPIGGTPPRNGRRSTSRSGDPE